MKERAWPPAIGVFALLLGVILTAYIAGNEARQIRNRQRSDVAAQAGVVRAKLESEINSAA